MKLAFAWMATVFVVHAVIFFTRTAPSFVHSDAATEVLVAALAVESKRPLVSNFYYVNGDYWFFGSHWFAAPFIPFLGASARSLFATNAFGLAVELAALTWAFWRVSRSLLASAFAAAVTLFSWSTVHMYYAYVEGTYGIFATVYFIAFALYAKVFTTHATRRDTAIALGYFFLLAVQNPSRVIAFALLPLLVGCLWRWEGTSRVRQRRIAMLTVAVAIAAFPVQRFVLRPLVTPAVQHPMSFGVRPPSGIVHNIGVLLKGVLAISEPRDDFPLSAAIGLVVLVGAVFWVGLSALRSRAYDPFRFASIVVLAELGLLFGLLVIGDIVVDERSTRYLLPALLPLLGLGCLAATRAILENGSRARLALAWLVLLPIDATMATTRRFGPREHFSQADPLRQQKASDELVRRGLVHGFATYWNANAMTLLSNGGTKTCGVVFNDDAVVPRKWLVGTDCFDKSRLPASIYVVTQADERERAARAMAMTFPPAVERFNVDDFEVSVFQTANCSLDWLELPRPRP